MATRSRSTTRTRVAARSAPTKNTDRATAHLRDCLLDPRDRFVRIEDAKQLPAPGSPYPEAFVHPVASTDATDATCIAIDVAALANHLGGTLLVGARGGRG